MQSVFDELGLAGTMVVGFFIRLGMLAFTAFDVLRCWLSFSRSAQRREADDLSIARSMPISQRDRGPRGN
jgi:hypothetical protein